MERRRRFDHQRIKPGYDEQDSNQTPQKIDIALGAVVNRAGNHGADDGTPGLNENHDATDLGKVGATEEFPDTGPIYWKRRFHYRE